MCPKHTQHQKWQVYPSRLVSYFRMIGRKAQGWLGRGVANNLIDYLAVPSARRLNHAIVQDEFSFKALQSEWEALFLRAAVQTPFLRYSWLQLCWDRQRNIKGKSLFIVVVRENGRPVLIAPLLRQGRRLSFLDSLTPQYNDVLVEGSVNASRYLDYFWESLAGMRSIRQLVPKWVRNDSLLGQYLAKAPQEAEAPSFRASFIDLTKFGEWEDYLQGLSRKVRQDHRRRLRLLEKRGAVKFRLASGDTYRDSIAWLFAQKRKWLDRTGKSSSWLKAPQTEEFFAAAVKEGIDSGRTWLTVLAVDGETIAAVLSFREGSTLYLSKIAYDPAWQTYSPGRTLILLTIQRAFQEGLRGVDLMIGRYTWKRWLATGTIKGVRRRKIRLYSYQ